MDKNTPKKKIDKTLIIKKTANELTDFDLIPIRLDKILVSVNDEVLVLLVADDKQVAFPINSIEATMLTFVHCGCTSNTHINTIYHMYIGLLREINTKIESATIEAQDGDIWYARLKITNNKNKTVYSQCSVGDALVLSLFTEAKLYIVRKALDEADIFEDLDDDDFIMEEE